MSTVGNISIKQGDDISLPLTITSSSGGVLDLTGATAAFHLRAFGAATDAITPAPTLTLTDAAHGVAALILSAAQTGALTGERTYQYEVEITDVLGKISTPIQGLCYVEADLG